MNVTKEEVISTYGLHSALSMTGWARGWIPEQILKFRRCARAGDLAMIRARGIVLVKAQQVQMVYKIHD